MGVSKTVILRYSQSVLDLRLENDWHPTFGIPIYPVKLRKKLELFDFSINTCILPMSSIAKHYKSGDEHKDKCIELNLIEHGLSDSRLDYAVEALSTFEKILRAPVCADCSIKGRLHTHLKNTTPCGHVMFSTSDWLCVLAHRALDGSRADVSDRRRTDQGTGGRLRQMGDARVVHDARELRRVHV